MISPASHSGQAAATHSHICSGDCHLPQARGSKISLRIGKPILWGHARLSEYHRCINGRCQAATRVECETRHPAPRRSSRYLFHQASKRATSSHPLFPTQTADDHVCMFHLPPTYNTITSALRIELYSNCRASVGIAYGKTRSAGESTNRGRDRIRAETKAKLERMKASSFSRRYPPMVP
jgi:hypothetical protein